MRVSRIYCDVCHKDISDLSPLWEVSCSEGRIGNAELITFKYDETFSDVCSFECAQRICNKMKTDHGCRRFRIESYFSDNKNRVKEFERTREGLQAE